MTAASPAIAPMFFDLDADDDFGDFEFASSSIPARIPTDFDYEWDDFVDSTGIAKQGLEIDHDRPLRSTAVSVDPPDLTLVNESKAWRKPSGPLSLSLFGADEEEAGEGGLTSEFDSSFGSSVLPKSKSSAFSQGVDLKDLIVGLYGLEGNAPTVASEIKDDIGPSSKTFEDKLQEGAEEEDDFEENSWDFKFAPSVANGLEFFDAPLKKDGDVAAISEVGGTAFDDDPFFQGYEHASGGSVLNPDIPTINDHFGIFAETKGLSTYIENSNGFIGEENHGQTSSLEDLFTPSLEIQTVDNRAKDLEDDASVFMSKDLISHVNDDVSKTSHAHATETIGTATDEDAQPPDSDTHKLTELVDFYSRLKESSCALALHHIDNLKMRRKHALVTDKEQASLASDSEIDATFNRLRFPDPSAGQKGNRSQDALPPNELREHLKDSGLQVFNQEFLLTEKISSAENNLSSAMWIFEHASFVLHIFTQFSIEEQSFYISSWARMASECLLELKHGTMIWSKAVSANIQAELLRHNEGQLYFLALGEVYRVVEILKAAVRLYRPWLLVNAVDCEGILRDIDESAEVWKDSGLEQAFEFVPSASVHLKDVSKKLVASVNSISKLDGEALRRHISDKKVDLCRLSLLPFDIFPDILPIVWEDRQYFSKVANFWKNRVSRRPPSVSMVDGQLLKTE